MTSSEPLRQFAQQRSGAARDSIVRPAEFPEDAAVVLEIWQEFVASPSVSLDFQDYEAEFSNFPGKYARPSGRVLIAEHNGRAVGCVAFRPVNTSICEMKRLYVRPAARGAGLGRELVERLLTEARDAGYDEMRLDVLAEFAPARRLYAELEFTPADPVSFNPLPGAAFLGRKLR